MYLMKLVMKVKKLGAMMGMVVLLMPMVMTIV